MSDSKSEENLKLIKLHEVTNSTAYWNAEDCLDHTFNIIKKHTNNETLKVMTLVLTEDNESYNVTINSCGLDITDRIKLLEIAKLNLYRELTSE